MKSKKQEIETLKNVPLQELISGQQRMFTQIYEEIGEVKNSRKFNEPSKYIDNETIAAQALI